MRKQHLEESLLVYETRLKARNWEWESPRDGLCQLISELCEDRSISREEYYRGIAYIKGCLEPYRDYRYNRSLLMSSERRKAFYYLKEAFLEGCYRSQASKSATFWQLFKWKIGVFLLKAKVKLSKGR